MKLTIRMKLLAGFGVVLVLMLGVGGYSLLQVKGISAMLSKMYSSEVIGVGIIKDANIHLISRGRAEKNAILASDPAEIEKQIVAAEEAAAKLNVSLDQYEPLISTEKGRALFKEIRQLWGQFEPIQATIFREARRNDDGAAIANAASGRALVNRMDENLAQIATLKEGVAKRNSDLAQADATAAFWVILGFLVTAMLAGTGIGLLLAQQIAQGALKMAAAAEGISQGDLEQHVALTSRDELGDMARSFQRMIDYLREMADSAHEVSRGNLSISVQPRSPRDTLGNALSQMVGNLREIVQRVRTASETVGAGAQQIASSSTELAKTVSVQASSAEETSAAMEEMAANIQSVDKSAQDLGAKVTLVRTQSEDLAAAVTQTSSSISELAASVQQVAGNVGHASQRAEEAAQAANAGDRAVMQTTAGMNAIAETMNGIRQTIQVLDQRSGEIGAIIEVIDDIAEQTNLLALNAAIEAARAGDAGRGFAVVADEVRKLAERSAKATGEIGSLIKGIQRETAQAVGVTTEGASKVQEGVELADHTSQALTKIKVAADHVTSLLSEVAAATSEQARASQQIVVASEQMAGVNQKVTQAVSEMDQLTKSVTYATGEQRQGTDQVVIAVESLSRSSREASAATDQVSAAADSLSEQARVLQEAVAFFRLADQTAGRPIELQVGSRTPLSLPARI